MTVRRKRVPRNILRQKAERARDLWEWGIDRDGLLDNPEEARACWQLVREQYLRWQPPGNIEPKFGTIEYGPWAWWQYDCLSAPFIYEPIEGLPDYYAQWHARFIALKAWRFIPPDTPEPSLMRRAEEIERMYQAKLSGRDNFMPFPTGTKPEEMERKWQEVKAERQAWAELGYL